LQSKELSTVTIIISTISIYTRDNIHAHLQTSCNKVVVKSMSGCVRTARSQLLWQVWNKLLSPCYEVDDSNSLATSCSNKTDRVVTSCYELVVNIRLVGTCCESVDPINLVTRW
jgi:hypothetical protein